MNIRRRLMLNEAMNFCERRGWTYQITWNMEFQWLFDVAGKKEKAELLAHLERWNTE